MNKKNEKIVKACAFCKHAIFTFPEEKSPALTFLKADFSDETISLHCPYKKNATPDFSCRRFCFDPLKYRPSKMLAIPTLDEETLILD